MKKMYVALLVAALACGTLFAGCGSKTAEDTQSSNVGRTDDSDANVNAGADDSDAGAGNSGSSDDGGSIMDDISNALQAGGRDYGEVIELTTNDVMHSDFFDLKVNSVATADELEDYVPVDDSYTFLVVNVSITNTFDQDDPMSYADFPVVWGGVTFPVDWEQVGDDEYAIPESDFTTALPDEYNIEAGGTVTGDLIYTVPKDLGSVTMEYYDLYSDEFRGNTFLMTINY